MWVRRALQRAEPRAHLGLKGRSAGRLLAAVQIAHLNRQRADGWKPGADMENETAAKYSIRVYFMINPE
jgi:hypothetical protein